jgi:hypothetical protein
MAHLPRTPDLDSQRAAMKQLSFLLGKWTGEARLWLDPGEPLELLQTEKVEYKLDGLLMLIEGLGRNKTDGQAVLHALAIVSYDDEVATYRMRAFNDGRFLETELRPLDGKKGLTWGFVLGEIRTNSRLEISEKEQWTELTEITRRSQPSRRLMELKVRPEK